MATVRVSLILQSCTYITISLQQSIYRISWGRPVPGGSIHEEWHLGDSVKAQVPGAAQDPGDLWRFQHRHASVSEVLVDVLASECRRAVHCGHVQRGEESRRVARACGP